MNRSVIETIMGAVVLIAAGGFIYLVFQSGSVGGQNGYALTAEFDNASGLSPGAEVRMSGVKIGIVSTQTLDPASFFAVVTMNIDNAILLPRDTSARILADGLLGANFVSLEPGGDMENLKPGEQITFTQGSINVVDLLGRFIFSAAESATKTE